MTDDTFHYKTDRKLREEFIQEVIGGYGNLIHQGYTRNKFNKWLSEIHKVYDNGIIIVVNPYRGMDRIVTSKIARPMQMRAAVGLPYFVKIENKKVVTKESDTVIPEFTEILVSFYVSNGWNNDLNIPPKSDWDFWKSEVEIIKRRKR